MTFQAFKGVENKSIHLTVGGRKSKGYFWREISKRGNLEPAAGEGLLEDVRSGAEC